jgi:hypothetical protein
VTLSVLQADHQLSAIIEFTCKSRQMVRDYKAVQKALENKLTSLVICHHETSQGTINKKRKINEKEKIGIASTDPGTDWLRLWGIPSHKMLGVVSGELASNSIQKVRAGV